MSTALEIGKNSMLRTDMDNVSEDVDEYVDTNDDIEEPLSPFSRVDVTNILSPSLIKIDDDGDEDPPPAHRRHSQVAKEVVCMVCFKKFKCKQTLICHYSNEHFGPSRFTCDICTRKFGHEDLFMTHCRQHNGSKPFYCPLCNTWFCDLADINSHTQEFQFRDPIHCSVCGQRSARKFKCLFEKQSHVMFKKYSKSVSTTLYYCKQCQPKDSHDCAVCGRIFTQPGYLRQHYNSSHRNVEPYRCDECFVGFSSRCILERHLETHPGRQKPWVCHMCGLRFQWQDAHVNHMQDHKALKPFTCNVCGENFHFENELKLHVSKHNDVCANESSSRSSLMSGCEGNDHLNRNNDLPVSEICSSSSDKSSMDVQACVQVKLESCSDGIQMEGDSHGQSIDKDEGNVNRHRVDPMLQNNSPPFAHQCVKQDVINAKHGVFDRNSFKSTKLDCIKQEVLSDDDGSTFAQDDNAIGSQIKGNTHSYTGIAVDSIKKEIDQNVEDSSACQNDPHSGWCDSAISTLACREGSTRQAEESEFPLQFVNTDTISKKENDIPTISRDMESQGIQNSMQQDGDKCDSIKKESCLAENGSDNAISLAEDEDNEFCPLDLLCFEITSFNDETPDAGNNSVSPSVGNGGTGTFFTVSRPSLPGHLSKGGDPVVDRECRNTFLSEELNIGCDSEEASNRRVSSNGYWDEARDQMEYESAVSADPDMCFGNLAEKSTSSLGLGGQKNPLNVQLNRGPVTPAESLRNAELELLSLPAESLRSAELELLSLHRMPPQKNAAMQRHKCCFCNKFLDSSIALRQHYRTIHEGVPRHPCRMCRKQFHRSCDLRKHISLSHKTNFCCILCNKKCMKKVALDMHYERHLSKTPYFCQPCHTWFRDLDELESHRSCSRPFEKLHYCSRCGLKNAWKFERMRGDGNAYLCEACEHHPGKKKADTCKGCGRIFRIGVKLEAHYIREHTGRYRCNDCTLCFDTKCILLAHEETMCGMQEALTCNACGRQLRSLAALQQHAEAHNVLRCPQRQFIRH